MGTIERARGGLRLHVAVCFGLLLGAGLMAAAGDIGITYVKTLGQSWPALPMNTGGGRLSVDAQGNIYAGTPGQNSFLQKITPEGRVVWRADDTHCAYTGTAVDDQYVYGCGIGYYGYKHLLRRKKVSGVMPAGWRFVWPKDTDVVQGVRGFAHPGALLVDAGYLYVLDIGNGELRRLDKASGQEKALAAPIKVEGAKDMAFSHAGALLVLAKDSVVEFDRATGKPLRAKVLTGLAGPTAIAVHPRTGVIYIAEGGTNEKPVNQVRLFTATGAPSGQPIGRGGEWQGKWTANSFGFSSGTGDIALDGAGGFWANCYAHRAYRLPLITHFSAAGTPDRVLMGAYGEGVVADSALNAYVGGNYSIDWDNALRWTSGLISTGKPNQFPTTIDYWPMKPISADAQQAIFFLMHHCRLIALNPETGESLGKDLAVPGPSIVGACAVGRAIYVTNGANVYRTTVDLAPLETIFPVPEAVKAKGVTGLALSADQTVLYLSAGSGEAATVFAFDGKGSRWEAKAGQLYTRYKGILLAENPTGPGFLALSADDGSLAGIFGNKAIDDRPLLWNPSGMGVGSKDGADYLFVAAQYRILVYRIAAGE